MRCQLKTLVVSCTLFVSALGSDIEAAFKKHKIIPDLIDEPPKELLEVKYKTIKGIYDVKLGNELHPIKVDNPPHEIKWKAEPGAYYTLFHLGPNLNGEKKWNEANFVHFLRTNIQKNDWNRGAANDEIADYIGSRPYTEFGSPYYVFLLYKQPGRIEFEEGRDPLDFNKTDFDLRKFLARYKIKELVAGNFYTSRYDWDVGFLTSLEPDDYETFSPKTL